MDATAASVSRIGRYEVLAPIAAGGMASVYVGRATGDGGRPVALKVIRPEHARNKDFVAMFLDEAQIASRLLHPNIVELVEFGHDGARYFLAMDLVLGQPLLRVAEMARVRDERLPYEVVAWIGARVADGLHHAHEQTDANGAPLGVVHRDVNPSNVLIGYDGVPKIIDFGLARAASRIASTAAGVVKGKLAYLAPEQAHGQTVDRRADVYQLGITLWELTVGRRLFKSDDDVETVRRVMSGEVADPRSIVAGFPSALADALMRALARDRDARTPTAAQLAKELDAFVAGRCDAARVAEIVNDLFPEAQRTSAWEMRARAIKTAPVPTEASGKLLAWDDDAQKMTWFHVEPEARPAPEAPIDRDALRALLAARADGTNDAVTAARACVELALLADEDGDRAAAEAHARTAIAIDPRCVAAHAILRRVLHARGAAVGLAEHLDVEIDAATSDDARADLLAERARLVAASGAASDAVRGAWERVLAVRADHAAALKGVEAAIDGDDAASARRRAEHLGRMAGAYVAEPKLAAWLHVERARLLDRVGDEGGAWGALDRALAIDAGLGPTRAACVAHAAVHRDAARLVALLDEEARLDADPARAARAELDAACAAILQLGDAERGRALLERAQRRAPTATTVDRRVIDELVRLHERAQRWAHARAARAARLASLEGRARAYELLRMAALAMRGGGDGAGATAEDRATAIADLEAARAIDPDAAGARDALDALLEGDAAKREALWIAEATREGDAAKRAAAWGRAATIAEARGDRASAVAHLRAAIAVAPDDAAVADRLSALLAPQHASDAEARARVAVALHAAERARDPARRVAMLERAGLAWEEAVGDATLAASAYEEALRIEPSRRSAMLGLQRCAARLGDATRLARALLDEAGVSSDAAEADALRVRAAEALAASDPDRALRLADEVLARDGADEAARAIAIALHRRAQRWGAVDRALADRVAHARDDAARVEAWMQRAEIQRGPLGAPAEALASLRAARAIDPTHPALGEAIVELVEVAGDARALRDALVALANEAREATDAAERSRHRARAAEIDELVLLDDAAAEEGYRAALADVGGDAWLAERLARVVARRDRERDAVEDPAARMARVEAELARDPNAPHALRELEAIARAQRSAPLLANALDRQASAFAADAPVLGALWAEAALVEWTLPESDSRDVFERVLSRAPSDRAALDALVRRALVAARAGDGAAREAAARGLAGLLAHAPDDGARLALRLQLAALLDPRDGAGDPRPALAQYRAALTIDPRSPTAAFGAARLAAVARDAEAGVAATCARADLATDVRARASLLVSAAGTLVATNDPRLGAPDDRRARAAELAERALVADPCSTSAAGLLVTLCEEAGWHDRLVAALRAALERADRPDAIATLGLELARIATSAASDRPIAIAALERVRASAPEHVPALLALGAAYAAERAWAEAAGALEAAALHARDAAAKKRALLGLAQVYGALPDRGADAERALRGACDVDPSDAGPLRALLDRLRAPDHARAAGAGEEIAAVLARLADAESARDAKGARLLELADARAALGDRAGAEKALVEGAALAPSAATTARVLAWATSPSDQARFLTAVARRGAELGGADPAVLAALARLEVDMLGRAVDGAAHARGALAANPALHEARATLARGLAQAGRHADAIATVLGAIDPDATPLLSLRDPAEPLAVLEASLAADRRDPEALVARELRAIAGGVDDAALVALVARRLGATRSVLLGRDALLARVAPDGAPRALFDLAAAIAGTEARVFREDLGEAGASTRDRLAPSHPLRALFDRLAATLGVEDAELAVAQDVAYARVVARDEPWIVAPAALLARAEPVQIATLARVLVRVALGAPWIERLPTEHVRALLVAGARTVVPGWGAELADGALEEAVLTYTAPLNKAIGRKQKKALAAIAPSIAASPPPTAQTADAFALAVARTELRAAFLSCGDLLATLEDLRALDADYARATATRSPAALAATLTHPLAGDVARFALSPAATALRRELGTIAGAPRG